MLPRIVLFVAVGWALVSCPTVSWARERVVAFGEKAEAREVNRSFSPYAHGPTKKFFILPAAQVVVVVATIDGTSDASATIHAFPEGTTAEGIDRWVNNQHSDALYPDAAQPERMIRVPEAKFRSKPRAVVGHEVGEKGDEYDRVPVAFTIEPFEDGDILVRASQGVLDAFARTKDLSPPRASPDLSQSLHRGFRRPRRGRGEVHTDAEVGIVMRAGGLLQVRRSSARLAA